MIRSKRLSRLLKKLFRKLQRIDFFRLKLQASPFDRAQG